MATADRGAADKIERQKIADTVEQVEEAGELEEEMPGVYLEKMKDATMIRWLIGNRHLPHRKFIVQSMKQLECKHMLACP